LQIEGIDKEEGKVLEDKNKTIIELDKGKSTIDKINIAFMELNEKYKENERIIDSKKADMIQILKDISDINNKINSSGIIIENLNNRKKQLYKEIEIKKQGLILVNLELDNIEGKIKELEGNINILRNESEKVKSEINTLTDKGRILDDKRNKCFDRLRTFEARYNTLSDMEKDMEGFNRAVKSVISKYKDHNKVFGVVSDLIQVPKGFEIAVEIALGAAVQNIVTDNEETTGFLINYLKKNNFGRATFCL
jgi:chromosome segregation protein